MQQFIVKNKINYINYYQENGYIDVYFEKDHMIHINNKNITNFLNQLHDEQIKIITVNPY